MANNMLSKKIMEAPLHSGRKRQFLSIRVILQKVIFWGKITFSTKKNVGITYFCQPKKILEPESRHMTLIFVNQI
jgi:hypothetical protein